VFDLTGQGWLQLEELALAFVLSAMVGVEREIRQKSAGLKTHTLVGVSAALFMLISKYGFMDILADGRVVLDPSRVSAQIVSGIGFIGGGVIFMRRDIVRGLTTAASIWFTAALGMACGAGLFILAIATTAIHFAVMLGFPILASRLPQRGRLQSEIHIKYFDGRGALRLILIRCTDLKFAVDRVRLEHGISSSVPHNDAIDTADLEGTELRSTPSTMVSLSMRVKGTSPVSLLISSLSEIEGVQEVALEDRESVLD
jgi:putative Mg2+ transporter-C (MgtC) family protein